MPPGRLGTGTAAGRDVLTRRPVRVADPELVLCGGVVRVKGTVARRLGGRARVRFGPVAVWVRPAAAEADAPSAA